MHYYKRNLGDYAKKAGRLSMLQHGAYTLLIDACYDREQFPTLEEAIDWTWASSTAEIEAVEFVLRKFFTLEDGRYVQKRIQEEIEAYRAVSETNARIAKERETNRANNTTKRARIVNEAPRIENEAPPNQEPLTINQEPIGSAPKGAAAVAAEKTSDDMTRDELWSAGKSLLTQAGIPAKQCGSFVGKLVKDYGDAVVVEAVRAAVVARPADPAEYLKAACMRAIGQRITPNKQEALEQRNSQIAAEWAAQGA